MANTSTPDPNPNNEPSRSPLMLIIMAAVIVLGILAFFLLKGQGGGGGTQQTNPASPKSFLAPPSRPVDTPQLLVS